MRAAKIKKHIVEYLQLAQVFSLSIMISFQIILYAYVGVVVFL